MSAETQSSNTLSINGVELSLGQLAPAVDSISSVEKSQAELETRVNSLIAPIQSQIITLQNRLLLTQSTTPAAPAIIPSVIGPQSAAKATPTPLPPSAAKATPAAKATRKPTVSVMLSGYTEDVTVGGQSNHTGEAPSDNGAATTGTAPPTVGLVGPAFTHSEMEAPAGTKDMGSYEKKVYTAEQQERLGVDEDGNKVSTEESADSQKLTALLAQLKKVIESASN